MQQSDDEKLELEHLNTQKEMVVKFQKVFGGEYGQEVLIAILQSCGVGSTTPAGSDSHEIMRAEGKREVGFELMKMTGPDILQEINIMRELIKSEYGNGEAENEEF